MREDFICKFKTENFKIGSFDVYLDMSKELIKKNGGYSDEEAEEFLKEFPTSYRASILDKDDNYVGYITVYNNDAISSTYSLRMETNKNLSLEERNEISDEYKKWCTESLNFQNLEDEVYVSNEVIVKQNERVVKPSIVIPKGYLKPGISEDVLNHMKEFYSVPNLQFPFTIVDNGMVMGIIGVSNLIPSTRRAQLQLFFNKDIESALSYELGKVVIDDYVKYLHDIKINNVTAAVSSLDSKRIEMFDETSMFKWADIPLASKFEGKIGSKTMYQDVPGYTKKDSLYVPNNLVVSSDALIPEKKEKEEVLMVDANYRLVDPKSFEKYNIDINKLAREYGKCFEDRENFTKTLGEDKYIPQIGNGKYGLISDLSNLSYILLDRDNKFAGFVNNLRDDEENGNMEVESAIIPALQGKGIGTKMASAFNDEMFKLGYTGITGAVTSTYNSKSVKINTNVSAVFNGIRIEAYYINGKYFDMPYFTKINPKYDDTSKSR